MYVTASQFLRMSRENTVKKPEIKAFENVNTADPTVFGPYLWISLHISAAHYPFNPSPIVRRRIKDRILALPYEIPCEKCRPHALSYIESKASELDKAVSCRSELVKFYVDFHNYVNTFLKKPTWTYEQAIKYYGEKSEKSSFEEFMDYR